jgi:hypothetical protein
MKTKNAAIKISLALAALAALAACQNSESKQNTDGVSVADFGVGTNPEASNKYDAGSKIDFWLKIKAPDDVSPLYASINDKKAKTKISKASSGEYYTVDDSTFVMPSTDYSEFRLFSVYYTVGSSSDIKTYSCDIKAFAYKKETNVNVDEDGITLVSFTSPISGLTNVVYSSSPIKASIKMTVGTTVDKTKPISLSVKKSDPSGLSEVQTIVLSPSNGVYPSDISITPWADYSEQTITLTSAEYTSTNSGKATYSSFSSNNSFSFTMVAPTSGILSAKLINNDNTFFADMNNVLSGPVGAETSIALMYKNGSTSITSYQNELFAVMTMSDQYGDTFDAWSSEISDFASRISYYEIDASFPAGTFSNKDYVSQKISLCYVSNDGEISHGGMKFKELSVISTSAISFSLYDLVIPEWTGNAKSSGDLIYGSSGLSSLGSDKRAILKGNVTSKRGENSMVAISDLKCTLNGNGKTISDNPNEGSPLPFFKKISGEVDYTNFNAYRTVDVGVQKKASVVADENDGTMKAIGIYGKATYGNTTSESEITGVVGVNKGKMVDIQNCLRFSCAFNGTSASAPSRSLYLLVKDNTGTIDGVASYCSYFNLQNDSAGNSLTNNVYFITGTNEGSVSNVYNGINSESYKGTSSSGYETIAFGWSYKVGFHYFPVGSDSVEDRMVISSDFHYLLMNFDAIVGFSTVDSTVSDMSNNYSTLLSTNFSKDDEKTAYLKQYIVFEDKKIGTFPLKSCGYHQYAVSSFLKSDQQTVGRSASKNNPETSVEWNKTFGEGGILDFASHGTWKLDDGTPSLKSFKSPNLVGTFDGDFNS